MGDEAVKQSVSALGTTAWRLRTLFKIDELSIPKAGIRIFDIFNDILEKMEHDPEVEYNEHNDTQYRQSMIP